MSGYVLFQMWGPYRQSLIKGHSFYVEQARKRLLSQFDDMEGEAERASEEWLEQRGQHFDPDRHDPSDFYEAAHEVAIEFYSLLSDMREQTRLSVVAGMYHEWEKQLRDWLVREIRHWHRGDIASLKVWLANFEQITALLESFGWNLRGADYFHKLDACRLVVNVHKHGEGTALEYLRQKYPEYLDDPFSGVGGTLSEPRHRDRTHLRVSDDQFQEFSDAIVAFWRDVPENVAESRITEPPGWFEKAILTDRANQQRKTSSK